MPNWDKDISKAMSTMHAQWSAAKTYIKKKLGIQNSISIMPFWSYGTPDTLYLQGRVLKDEGIALQEENAPLWENILNMYRRFETDELPGVEVRLSVGEQQHLVTTDQKGFFKTELQLDQHLGSDRLWHPVQVELSSDKYSHRFETTIGEVIVVSEQAEFGIISDIDDTIVHTAANQLFKMIYLAYLGNERTRRPFAGVSQFYEGLQQGASGEAGNPIFYVSSSAWNMYDLFAKFMNLNQIPQGPILLRGIELSLSNLLSFDHESHKLEHIRPILERFPDLNFVLIGDTGQKDAEIYHRVAQEYPGRILAIYLRDVTPQDGDRQKYLESLGASLHQQGIEFLAFPHTMKAAHHAAKQGWISKSTLDQILW
mgnify:CR=1 FL=1